MNTRFSKILAAAIFTLCLTVAGNASDKIQTYVDANGNRVFKNSDGENARPIPAVLSATVSDPIRTMITNIASNHGMDPELVHAVVKTESNYDRWAVSRKGARGLMQLIPATGKRFGVRDFFDARQNVEGGVQYLKFLLEKFNGDLDLSLAAYNAGENLVEKLGRIPPIPETRDYVRRVRANYGKPYTPQVVTSSVAKPVETSTAEPPKIFRSVDERGVVHFSNVAPQR